MVLPLKYGIKSVRLRWFSALMALAGIAGAVAVFVATLALASGFEATLVSSGSPSNALLRRVGATADMDSMLPLEDVRVIGDAPEVARDGAGPVSSAEAVVIAPLPRLAGDGDANVRIRGVGPRAFDVHEAVRLLAGRRLRFGLPELVVGKEAAAAYRGLALGDTPSFGGTVWTVVGVFDSGGSAFDSEAWADSDLLRPSFKIPLDVVQAVVVRLVSVGALDALRARVTSDPRLRVQIDRETEYYAKASQTMSNLILGLGSLITALMGVGAVLVALNTMYSALAQRTREVATLRALGFGRGAVIFSLMIESCVVAVTGGLLGCLVVLPLNGVTTSTLNFQTFSHLAFAFQVRAAFLALGLLFALLMGLFGGLGPAVRAARLPVAVALREP